MRSKKHHYLPRHYLKGFTDSQNCFFVYDKQADKIIPPTTPDAAFFENNLNTVTFPDGNTSDFLEDLYSDMETSSWESLDNIRKSNSKTPIKISDKRSLFLFLSFLHWRLPSNIDFVEQLSGKWFLDNNELDYFKLKSSTHEKVPDEVKEKIKNSPAFKKTSKILIPWAPFFKDNNWDVTLQYWRFFYTGDEKTWYIVGDNPLITKGESDHDPVNCLKEFVFPVSGKILLVNVNKTVSKDLPPECLVDCNISIFERAERFVACQDKNFLESLIKYYKLHAQYRKTNIIIPEMFHMLEN
jgi:hypothetical protein